MGGIIFMREYKRPNVSFRIDNEFLEVLDNKAEDIGVTRSELLQKLVYQVLEYTPDKNPYATLTVGELQNVLNVLPEKLPLIAYTENEDYAITGVNLLSLLAGLKLESLEKRVDKSEWTLKELKKG